MLKLPAWPSPHTLNAVNTANRHELFIKVATPDDDTVTKAGSLLLKLSSDDKGENEVTALANEVPSLKLTATVAAEEAPV